ncbi:MAG: hypothetical protein KatS3mg076_2154 [Candidatus Binatia bacterium]|nr:MAG: hypothetical protein KatS3mg076_2154 [Candidatus Binatia bacterium]
MGFAWGIVLVALATAALRLWGIHWGAPFVYHPDEHFVLHAALDIVRTGDPNPHWFEYPSLWIYVEALLVLVLEPFVDAPLTTNHLLTGLGPWDALPEQWPFVLAGRVATAGMAVAGVVATGFAGRALFGPRAGLAGAVFLALAPLHNRSAHYLLTDVPAACFVAASLAACAAARPRWVLAGFLAGLGAGTKYTAGIALVPALVLLAGEGWRRETLRHGVWLVLAALLGFLAATPFALFDLPAFLSGLEAQRRNYLRGFYYGPNWPWYAAYLFRQGLGPVPTVAAAVGLLWAVTAGIRGLLRRPGSKGLRLVALALPVLLYYPWVSSYPSRAERNLMVLLPYLCLLAGWVCDRLSRLPGREKLGAWVLVAVVALGGATPFREVVRQNRRFLLPDTRTLALEWIEANLPEGAKIAREEYTPQIRPDRYRVVYLWSLAWRPYGWYLSEGVDYLVASSHIYGRAQGRERLGGEAAREFYRVLEGLPLLREFRPGEGSKGPTIRIYRVPRRSSATRERTGAPRPSRKNASR